MYLCRKLKHNNKSVTCCKIESKTSFRLPIRLQKNENHDNKNAN